MSRHTERSLRRVINRADVLDALDTENSAFGRRRHDGLRRLWLSGRVSGPQWWAAECFRDDLALAASARLEMPDAWNVRFSGCAFSGLQPGDIQIHANTRCRGAWEAVGLVAAGVVSWVVVSGGAVSDYDATRGHRRGRSLATLVSALDRLDVYYQAVKRTA